MKTPPITMFAPRPFMKVSLRFLAVAGLTGASISVFAASQTWSNAPVSPNWVTAANWVSNAVPGGVNSTTTADIATFNSPIGGGGFGGASSPITNDFQRGIRSIRFDTVGCGAYVFGSSPADNSLELTHLGDITINPGVTNPIIFNQGVRLRVPGSTDQRYDITNNATDPRATLYFSVITNGSANTRPWNFFLAGSNTGTNTIARIDDSPNSGTAGSSGAILITKVGPGTWIFSGANDLPQKTSNNNIAKVAVTEGTLIVKDPGALGGITAGNLTISNSVLQIDGVSPNNLGMTLRNGGNIRMNGSGIINGLTVANQAGNNCTLSTVSASDVLTNGSLGVNAGGLADSVLNLTGPGTIQLEIASTYIGNWVFSAATNRINNASALGTGPNATISAGAVLDTTLLGATTYTLTTAGLSANGTGTGVGSTASTIIADPAGVFDAGSKNISLTFTPTSFSGDTTHPALYVAQGTLSLNGNGFLVNNNGGTPLGVGTYRLIRQASGNVTTSGTAYALVSGAGLAAGTVAEILISGGNVDLVVSAHVALNLKWKGGNPDNVWDKLTTANFDNGGVFAQFGTGDAATFDSLGSAFPTVSLAGTLLPTSVKVDTSANDYTFTGAGLVAGAASLTKISAGTLNLQTVNTYVGGTVISNGTLRVGVNDAVSSGGSGNVAVYGSGVLDLNGFNNTINGLTGNGTVNVQNGGASVLTVGFNGASSTFTGLLANTSGTLGLTKAGNGQLTLSGAHTYTGPTVINAGSIVARHQNALGSGASAVAVNGGSLLTVSNLNVSSLTGAAGTTVANTTGGSTNNAITHTGTGNYTGIIANGAAGTILRVVVPSGTLQLNAVNTYSGGTFVAGGATLAIGVINPGGSGNAGTGGIIASNGAVLSLPTTVSTAAAPGNNITNVDAGGTITLSSAAQGNSYGGQFFGAANNTNVFVGPGSFGGATTFSNFNGTVVISNGSSWRFFNALGGGDSATFLVEGGLFSRDPNTIRLGALLGANGGIFNPSFTGGATWLIGAKNLSTTFSGLVLGSNNIVKVGTGSLTLNGINYFTNTVTLPDTTVVDYTLFSNRVAHVSNTTVSNGILRVVAPNNLTNSPNITLAGGSAILDASQIGYATNETTLDINTTDQPTNTVVVTTKRVDVLAGQTLNGVGTLWGSVRADVGSTLNPGNMTGSITNGSGTGVMLITNQAAIFGAVNMRLNRTNVVKADQLSVGSFAIDSGATLTVANVGPTLRPGDKFTLFFPPASFNPGNISLPATDASGFVSYTWQNDLALDGSITVLSGLNTNAPVLTNGLNGSTLALTWPTGHTGWTLQTQTNTLAVGISNNWSAIVGSALTNQVIVSVVKTNPTVFYRLTLSLP